MNQVEIREFQQDDLDQIIKIQEAIIQRPVSPNWTNVLQQQLAKPEGIDLVAVRDDEVIGFLHCAVKHGDFGLEQSGWFEMFGVHPKAMGEGVGQALAQAAFSRFRDLGISDIYTAVRWDSGDLLAFFKSIGFSLSNFINLKTKLD
jgi:ribosomal protein S18 acetylase RimI-like enzyme